MKKTNHLLKYFIPPCRREKEPTASITTPSVSCRFFKSGAGVYSLSDKSYEFKKATFFCSAATNRTA
ncbi:MAG: hypothetical protein L6V93_08830 [Clostridiales bacterium]|nr:MAG: hypothetical protein L6V93_08830 [Clostridiales bacterium]